jgi:hypothetical protein
MYNSIKHNLFVVKYLEKKTWTTLMIGASFEAREFEENS